MRKSIFKQVITAMGKLNMIMLPEPLLKQTHTSLRSNHMKPMKSLQKSIQSTRQPMKITPLH